MFGVRSTQTLVEIYNSRGLGEDAEVLDSHGWPGIGLNSSTLAASSTPAAIAEVDLYFAAENPKLYYLIVLVFLRNVKIFWIHNEYYLEQ